MMDNDKSISIECTKVAKDMDVVAFMALGFVNRSEYNQHSINGSKPLQIVNDGKVIFECEPVFAIGSMYDVSDKLHSIVCETTSKFNKQREEHGS